MRRKFKNLCTCCMEPEVGLGVQGREETLWTCGKHFKLGKRLTNMAVKDLVAMKKESLGKADEALGNYLMSIEVYDIRDLNETQALEMLKKAFEAYAKHLDSLLDDEIPY